MNLQTSLKTCLVEKYARFTGRATRSEFWWFALVLGIGAIVASFLGFILYLIYMLALIVPYAAVGFRRLQDTGRPGWYLLIPIAVSAVGMFLTPAMPVTEDGMMTQMPSMASGGLLMVLGLVQLVLGLVFLWWLTRPSQPEPNEYGPPPTA